MLGTATRIPVATQTKDEAERSSSTHTSNSTHTHTSERHRSHDAHGSRPHTVIYTETSALKHMQYHSDAMQQTKTMVNCMCRHCASFRPELFMKHEINAISGNVVDTSPAKGDNFERELPRGEQHSANTQGGNRYLCADPRSPSAYSATSCRASRHLP